MPLCPTLQMVRVFLDDGVTAKVHILGEGEPTRKALLAAVDADQLPTFLGGTCKCPGGCVSGSACTSPDGLVGSQRRILQYCQEYSRALAAKEINEHGQPIVAEIQKAPAITTSAPAPAFALVSAPAAEAPRMNGVSKRLVVPPAADEEVDRFVDARAQQAEKEYERQLAFRKAADYPAYPQPLPQAPTRGPPPSPSAAMRAAEAAAAAAHAAQEEARRAATEAATARAALEAAKAEAIAAELEARAAAKAAQYAVKQAELAARIASLTTA